MVVSIAIDMKSLRMFEKVILLERLSQQVTELERC